MKRTKHTRLKRTKGPNGATNGKALSVAPPKAKKKKAAKKDLGAPIKIPLGRPKLIETPEEFDAKVDEYVAWCLANWQPLTINGLQLYLGFTSHQGFYEYANYDDFSACVTRARKIVELSYELRLHGQNSTGAIFALKNLGWMDERGPQGWYAARRKRELGNGQEEEQEWTLDIGSLDDQTLEMLMDAFHQESQTRKRSPGGGHGGSTGPGGGGFGGGPGGSDTVH